VIVVVVAVTTALTLVPALLKLTGRRLVGRSVVERLPGFTWVLRRTGDVSSAEGVFSRLAGRVQRHPWLVLLGCLALLGLLASPVAGLQMRNSTVELLPPASSQRDFLATVGQQFPAAAAAPVQVVAAGTLEEVAAWSAEVAAVDGVAAVDPPAPLGAHVYLGVRLAAADPGGQEATDVVRALRDLEPGFDTWVGGQAANQIDFIEALGQDVWWAVGIVALATFVLLFLMTGSVLIPIKALITNVVSMSAALGVLVWGFQEGHLEGVLGFTSSGGIETYVVALIVAFGFGLAMDYEVFLLSRIKEMHDSGHDDDAAVRLGLQRSGRIITSAAVIIVVVFAGFMLGELLVIKQVGFALAVAVTIDATIVRMLLVPATMTLLGKWNWWAPRPLRAVYRKLAIVH
jgi:RND superfamily putative drug exporter